MRETVAALADLLVHAPFQPSSGVWELRTPQLLVSEELARWVGLDRAIRVDRHRRPWRRQRRWVEARDAARERVERALDPTTGLLPRVFGGEPTDVDAAALLTAINGFWSRRDPRTERVVRGTIELLERGAFLRRYRPFDDGFVGIEGCFVPASWWAVSALAVIGDIDGAERRADEMCRLLPRLQPEEWDVESGQPLGNTPLLWSHTEAARALYHLHVARIRRPFGPLGVALWVTGRRMRLRLTGDGPA
jgi:GH15 family glucan-1,4-alpha-glucosidase